MHSRLLPEEWKEIEMSNQREKEREKDQRLIKVSIPGF
jgi:hypothetical protein